MAESKSRKLHKSRTKGSDIIPYIYCDPCHDIKGKKLQVKGNCVSAHKKRKLTRDHQVKAKPTIHHKKQPIKGKIKDQASLSQKTMIKKKKLITEKCHQQVLRSYCRSHDPLCCKIHQTYSIQSLTTTSANINDFRQLKDLKKTVKKMKKRQYDNLSKAASQSLNIGKLHNDFKTPVLINSIDHTSSIRGSIILPNQQLLISDMYRAVKVLDLEQETIVSELKFPNLLWDITQTKADEFAVACCRDKKIQFVSLSSDKLSKGREVTVESRAYGLEYNEHQDNLIVTGCYPPKVEILSLTGTVIKRFENDATGNKLFKSPGYVALSQDKTMIYVTDYQQHSVTLMTLNGEVKAIFKDKSLLGPKGICVNRFGIVYVVGLSSHTVHQIVPGRDKLEPLLDQNHGLEKPITISYCDTEDKLYVGQMAFNRLKIFKMR